MSGSVSAQLVSLYCCGQHTHCTANTLCSSLDLFSVTVFLIIPSDSKLMHLDRALHKQKQTSPTDLSALFHSVFLFFIVGGLCMITDHIGEEYYPNF